MALTSASAISLDLASAKAVSKVSFSALTSAPALALAAATALPRATTVSVLCSSLALAAARARESVSALIQNIGRNAPFHNLHANKPWPQRWDAVSPWALPGLPQFHTHNYVLVDADDSKGTKPLTVGPV
jgi:hypothetical protein